MKDRFSRFFRGLVLALVFLLPVRAFSQGTQIPFGQNRVQYKEFTWQYYESDHFIVYFNAGGQNLGRFAAQIAENDLEAVEDLLDYKLNTKPEIIVYNNISDYNQSNFAIGKETEYNIGGETKIIGNKVFVYFNGDHQDLRMQIREGVGKILVNTMIFGGSLQEIVQNAVLLNLPEWFTEGLVDYIGQDWSSELDNKLRDGILSGRYKKFNALTGEDARFAGHALWYYIAEHYGEANIPNLLYLIRINRSIENGFLFVLGNSVNQTIDAWYQYFLAKYQAESKDKSMPDEADHIPRKNKKNVEYHGLKLSPDGQHIAYAADDHGKFKVYIQDIDDKHGHRVKKAGLKTRTLATDLSNPLIAWSPDGKKLAILYEKRDKNMITTYTVDDKQKETKELTRFQKILSASFANTSNRLVMSVEDKGQTDIFMYYLKNDRVEQLTNDYYDDLDPSYVDLNNGFEGILFASNRDIDSLYTTRVIDSILPVGNMDLYFYDYVHKSKHLVQVTHTRSISESSPVQIEGKYFAYLSDQNGIVNRFAGYLDSLYDHTDTVVYFKDSTVTNPPYPIPEMQSWAIFDSLQYVDVYRDTAYTFPITNYATNILEQDAVWKSGKMVQVFNTGNGPQFYRTQVPPDLSRFEGNELHNTAFRNFLETKKTEDRGNKAGSQDTVPEKKKEETVADTVTKQADEGMYFQTEFPEPDANQMAEEYPLNLSPSTNPEQDNLNTGSKFRSSRILPYRIKFSSDYVISQLDNSLYINKYESFNANGGAFTNPDLSALFSVSISDLFEDYRFVGGLRLPTSFNGSEYYLHFDDLKRRLDKSLTWYYHSQASSYDFEPVWYPVVDGTVKTNIVEGSLKWPFDVIRSLRLSLDYRDDKVVYLANDTFSLDLPNYKEDWLSLRLEYTNDNTFPVMTNILNGLRYKIWFEIHKEFSINADNGLEIHLNDGYMGVVGFDFRHYQKIHRQLIWANRIAGGTSFGPQKLLYYLGGVDSWLVPQFDYNIDVDQSQGYAFQTLATPLRGYDENIRNGNSYAVFNSEIRIPLLSYLITKPIKSEFLRNFQVIGFFDVGSAWEGLSPFEADNPYNTVTISQPPISVDVKYFRNPVVAGTGVGVRTTLFGYFIRVDRAQPIESNGLGTPKWYFSLSLDF